ncbi:HNH endonuclease [Enterobacter cancerogenus]
MKLYGGRCGACGVTAQHGFVMLVDHIKPRSKFPHLALEINNLQVLCEDCNKAKSNTDDIKWRQ